MENDSYFNLYDNSYIIRGGKGLENDSYFNNDKMMILDRKRELKGDQSCDNNYHGDK